MEDIAGQPTPEPTPERQQPDLNRQLSHKKIAGRKKLRRDEKKAYRTIRKLQEQIQNKQKRAKKYERNYRKLLRESQNQNEIAIVQKESPATKAQKLISSGSKHDVRKELTFGFTIKDTIQGNIDKSKSTKRRRLIQNVVASNLLKKYRLIEKAKVDLHLAKKSFAAKVDSSGMMVLNASTVRKRAARAMVGQLSQVAVTSILAFSFYL